MTAVLLEKEEVAAQEETLRWADAQSGNRRRRRLDKTGGPGGANWNKEDETGYGSEAPNEKEGKGDTEALTRGR